MSHPIGERNAAEIIAETKARSGRFRELKDRRIICDCQSNKGKRHRILARVYVGAADEGVIAEWVLVLAQRFGGGRESVPTLAYAVPRMAGEQVRQMTAQCPGCKAGWQLFLGGAGPGTVAAVRVAAPTLGVVVD